MSSQPTEKPAMTTNSAPVLHSYDQGQHHVVQHGPSREWSSGLCGCNAGGFLLSCCCPCITYGQNKQRYRALQNGVALREDQVEGCGKDTLLFCGVQCLIGAGWLFDFMLRSDVRERYRINGSAFGDFCTSCCCLPCSLEQQKRELNVEETSTQLHQQPQPQAQMTAPASY